MNTGPRRLLATSSDPIAVIRLEDGLLVEGNQALARLTGCGKDELVGRSGRELVVWLCPGSPTSVFFDPLAKGEAVSNLAVALRTRPGKLQVTRVSAIPLAIDGHAHALCTLRGHREPTRPERRMAAHVELGRLAERRPGWPGAASTAVEVLCECLGWDAGAFWQVDKDVEALRCVAFWHVENGNFQALEAASRQSRPLPGEGLLGRTWLSGAPSWVADVNTDPGFARRRAASRASVRGWFAWPVLAADRVVGMVELFSRASRPPDGDLLELGKGLGNHLGRLLGPDDPGAADPPQQAPRWSAGAPDDPPALLRELAASVGRLNRLLEQVVEHDRPAQQPPPARLDLASHTVGLPGGPQTGHQLGLTLKAVSERTGIPGATVRTWERRYGFIRPVRSASGYRLYRDDDIARILTVKRLLAEGVRVSDAAAVVDAPVRSVPDLPAESTG